MKKIKLVIIGGGMSGTKFAAELIKKSTRFAITILNEESDAGYNRILLSPVLAGEKKFSEISLQDKDWYSDNEISVVKPCVANHIDSINKLVVTESHGVFKYDQLIIATGSKPFVIPVPGCDSHGVVTFRTKSDVDKMLALVREPAESLSKKKKSIVIGAGLLGLEAANALAQQGAHVCVLNKSSHILNRQLNDKAAGLLQRYFEKKGIDFYLNSNTLEIKRNNNNKVTGLLLENGELISADIIVMAVGVRPNISVAENSGVDCKKGIIVDDCMQTNISDIFALGECVQFEDSLFGLVAPTYEQAGVLVNTLCKLSEKENSSESIDDSEMSFKIKPLATKLKVSGIDLFSAGDIQSRNNYQFLEYEDISNNIYKRLSICDNKIVGAVMFGDVLDGAWYFDLMNQQKDISKIRSKILFGKAICEPEATEESLSE